MRIKQSEDPRSSRPAGILGSSSFTVVTGGNAYTLSRSSLQIHRLKSFIRTSSYPYECGIAIGANQLPFAFKSWSVHTVNEVKNTFREALAEIRMRILIASNKLPCHTQLISIDTRWGENFGTPKVRTCSFWNSGTFHPRNSLISARSKEFTHCSSCWFLDLRFLLS